MTALLSRGRRRTSCGHKRPSLMDCFAASPVGGSRGEREAVLSFKYLLKGFDQLRSVGV